MTRIKFKFENKVEKQISVSSQSGEKKVKIMWKKLKYPALMFTCSMLDQVNSTVVAAAGTGARKDQTRSTSLQVPEYQDWVF